MPVGPPGDEKLVLNVDSLWTGGPFEKSVGDCGFLLLPQTLILISRVTQEEIQLRTCQAPWNRFDQRSLEKAPEVRSFDLQGASKC